VSDCSILLKFNLNLIIRQRMYTQVQGQEVKGQRTSQCEAIKRQRKFAKLLITQPQIVQFCSSLLYTRTVITRHPNVTRCIYCRLSRSKRQMSRSQYNSPTDCLISLKYGIGYGVWRHMTCHISHMSQLTTWKPICSKSMVKVTAQREVSTVKRFKTTILPDMAYFNQLQTRHRGLS